MKINFAVVTFIFAGELTKVNPARADHTTSAIEKFGSPFWVQEWSMDQNQLTKNSNAIDFDHTAQVQSGKVARGASFVVT